MCFWDVRLVPLETFLVPEDRSISVMTVASHMWVPLLFNIHYLTLCSRKGCIGKQKSS